MLVKNLFASAIALGLATPCAAISADIFWLSALAPKRAKAAGAADHARHDKTGKSQDMMGAGMGADEGNNDNNSVKHLWLRQGDVPVEAGYVKAVASAADINVLDAKGNRSRVAQTPTGGLAHAKFEFEEMGFYNAYLTQESVQDGVLRIQIAKAELSKSSMGINAANVDPDQKKAISDPTLALEIVREHKPDEKLSTRIVSGDKIALTINRLGKPLPGAQVTMLTQYGWQRKAVSDQNGRVDFMMIRDYFPPWNEFNRRSKESFVVVAETETSESGMYQGLAYTKVSYQTTLSGRYTTSPYDYRSYAWGLGIAVFTTAFSGLGVYLYRRRRVKPFQEVRFDEST